MALRFSLRWPPWVTFTIVADALSVRYFVTKVTDPYPTWQEDTDATAHHYLDPVVRRRWRLLRLFPVGSRRRPWHPRHRSVDRLGFVPARRSAHLRSQI